MGTACSRCHTPVAIDQAKCPVCGSAGIYEVSQLHIDKRKLDSDKRKLNVDKIREAEEEQIAKEEEAPKQQEHDNSVAANAALKQKLREKTIFITVMALILIGVAFSYTVFFGL